MTDARLSEYDYDYDEEGLGFGRPETAAAAEPVPASRRVAQGLIGLGLLALVAQVAGGLWTGTWLGFLSSYGLLTLGGSLYFWLALKDTTPGIKHDNVRFDGLLARGTAGLVAGVLFTGLYVLIYWYPSALGHHAGSPTGLVRTVNAPARLMSGGEASQWFLYGVLYSLVMVVFGVRMCMKYRHNAYQLVRTATVVSCQLLLAWILPNLLWRYSQSYYLEFNGVWPLKQDYLWPYKVGEFTASGSPLGISLLIYALAGALIATPVLTYYFGKRWYCSWVCGCGGLAETLGDPWRQLSSKSERAWKLERVLIYSVLALVLLTTLLLWLNHLKGWFGVAYTFKQWYGFAIGAVFSGVVGVGFYPLLGSRVWCRFGCPQAAILGILQRVFSRFRITTNGGQCISCGNCSTYCEMGIDVRAYAQQGENIVRASCVGCGVCAAACPRGVLKLENGKTHAGRY